MNKFGIFKAEAECRGNDFPKSSWDIVNTDEYIRNPVEVFETLEAAVEKLYTNSCYEPKCDKYSNGGVHYTNNRVYFVAEIEICDEDESPDDISNMTNGDGWAIRGIYCDEYEKGYTPEIPKITAINFIINGDTEYPYSGVKVEFPVQGNVYDGYIYCIDDVTVEEVEELCVYSTNKMNLEAIKEQFDLTSDGVGNKITEI